MKNFRPEFDREVLKAENAVGWINWIKGGQQAQERPKNLMYQGRKLSPFKKKPLFSDQDRHNARNITWREKENAEFRNYDDCAEKYLQKVQKARSQKNLQAQKKDQNQYYGQNGQNGQNGQIGETLQNWQHWQNYQNYQNGQNGQNSNKNRGQSGRARYPLNGRAVSRESSGSRFGFIAGDRKNLRVNSVLLDIDNADLNSSLNFAANRQNKGVYNARLNPQGRQLNQSGLL